MNEAENLSGAHTSLDAASEAENNSDEQSPYDIQELAAILTDFYRFLATLHYDPADLKLPPPEGWDSALLPANIVYSKSEDVVELMKRLPYFTENQKSTHVHYKSKLVDYTDPEGYDHAEMHDDFLDGLCAWCHGRGRGMHMRHRDHQYFRRHRHRSFASHCTGMSTTSKRTATATLTVWHRSAATYSCRRSI